MQTPELEYLCGGYFHQDWGLDYADEWAAIDDYLTDAGADPRQLALDIRNLLATSPADNDVERHLDRLDCNFSGESRYGGYRGWLEEIARRVRAAQT